MFKKEIELKNDLYNVNFTKRRGLHGKEQQVREGIFKNARSFG